MVTEAERKDRVDVITKAKAQALIEELRTMPPVSESISPEFLAQLKQERKALKPFQYIAPTAGVDHYLGRWLAWQAYEKINELVRVYDKTEK